MGDDFFNNLRQTLSDTAEVVGKKTEELVEVQKLRSRIRTAQKQAEQDYRKLGHMVFERFVEGEAMDLELSEVCDHLIQVRNQIASFEEELARKKGQCICPACGKANPTTAAYCMYCGTVMPEIKEEEPDAEWKKAEAAGDTASAGEESATPAPEPAAEKKEGSEETGKAASLGDIVEDPADTDLDADTQSTGRADQEEQK